MLPVLNRRAIFSSMHALPAQLLTLLVTFTVPIRAASTFHSSQNTINYGESCTLTWNSAANEAYILGIGRFAGSGSIQVAPAVPTYYILVVNAGKRV